MLINQKGKGVKDIVVKNKNIERVMSGILITHWVTKKLNGEDFEIRYSLLRLKSRNCFRVIHEEFYSKYQDASDLYQVDKKIDVEDLQDAIKYLEEHGVELEEMK